MPWAIVSWNYVRLPTQQTQTDVEEKKTNGVVWGSHVESNPCIETNRFMISLRPRLCIKSHSLCTSGGNLLTLRIDPTEMSDEKLGRKHRITVLNTSVQFITRMPVLTVQNNSPIIDRAMRGLCFELRVRRVCLCVCLFVWRVQPHALTDCHEIWN